MNGCTRTCVILATSLSVMLNGGARAQSAEKPVRGKDLVYFPAMDQGLCVQSLFQSNMVLQREKPISVWGWADAGEPVTVTFDGQTRSATAAVDRSWRVTFPALPASDRPRTMVISGTRTAITLDNILIGEVWVCAGQSNMEFPMSRTDNGDLELASARFENIHLLTIPQGVSQTPTRSFSRLEEWSDWDGSHFRKGFWDVCSPDAVAEFSGIGYTFARRLHMTTQVPIGMIDLSRGGTCIEAWTPVDVLRGMDNADIDTLLGEWDSKVKDWDPKKDLAQRVAEFRQRQKDGKVPDNAQEPNEPGPGPDVDMNRPGNCYGGMFGPIMGLPVRGAIWHQGYNNAFSDSTRCGETYQQTLTLMIAAWRRDLDNPDLAFGIIAQETDQEPQTLDNFLSGITDNGCLIREAHYKTFAALYNAGDRNVGFAASDDMRRAWYHPQIKIPVGERIARWALATQYGVGLRWLPPGVRDMKIDGNRLLVTLDTEVSAFNSGPILGFAIAGSDKKFYPAHAEYFVDDKKNTIRSVIVLTSPFVTEPAAYRYGWHRNPMGNLKISSCELPLPISRSDDWSLNDLYEAYTGKRTASAAQLTRAERAALDRALRTADQQRLFKEAEAYVKEHQGDKGN
jgi:sialate O-acetylesterase